MPWMHGPVHAGDIPKYSLSHSPSGRSQGSQAMGSTRLHDPKPAPSLPAFRHHVLQTGHIGVHCHCSARQAGLGTFPECQLAGKGVRMSLPVL